MKTRRFSILLVMLLGFFASAALLGGGRFGLGSAPDSTPTPMPEQPFPDAYKLAPRPPAELPVPHNKSPNHLTHPCGGMFAEPPFSGVSPLAIAYVPGMCGNGYGDIGVWQANGHDYVVQSGFAQRMFHLWNVDDPYNPQILRTQPFPAGGTASTAAFPFAQNGNRYIAITMRGSGTGCGYFIYDVNDPANPTFVSRTTGADWCTVHETFVSKDANGNADYAWLTMSGESGSGDKVVVLDLSNIAAPVQTGRYERPDRASFIHDSNVVGNLVFLAHWTGGLIIHDKATLATQTDPPSLNPVDSIRPAGFQIHHAVPSTDGRFVFIEDEFLNGSTQEKIKIYNITDLSNPVYVGGIVGSGAAQTSQAHNMVIQPISSGLDRLYVGWYKAGTRGFEINTTGATPVITETITHQLRQTAGSGFGGVWGVDYLPCMLDGQPHTCIYSSDYEKFGLIVDALGYDPSLDPYMPEAAITSPIPGQTITGCSFTIQGTGHDYYSGLSQVEVSTDDGATWQLATGTLNWSYEWSIPGDGTYNIRVRATDMAGNTYVPTNPVTVTVSGCSVTTPTPPPSFTTTPVVPTVTRTSTPQVTATNTPAQPTATNTANPSMTSTPIQPSSTATVVTASPTACTITFSDVFPDFAANIRCLACRGIVSGYSDGTFRPYNDITRAQIAKIVSNAAGYNEGIPTNRQTFEDVPPGSTFWLWIERMMINRGGVIIFSGYECGSPGEPCGEGNRPYFRPFSNATRGQLAKIVSNAARIETPPTGLFYTDVPQSNPFYVWIMRLTQAGVMSGYPCGVQAGEECDEQSRPYFRPFNNVTRGQASKIVANTFYPNCQTPSRR